jgi:hypothetical protein
MAKRIAIIGVEKREYELIKTAHFGPIIYHEMLPNFLVNKGQLFVERSNGNGMLPVDKVVYYGIFEDDFDIITALSIWGGPCFPNPRAMMDCRLKLPCLARALAVSQFASPRGMISPHTSINVTSELVAKWGNWHCGENKERLKGQWTSNEASVIEPYFEGEAVRICIIGDQYWQIKLEGQSWLKSIHDDRADFMEVDQELLEDTRRIQAAFGLDFLANDYIIGVDGQKHLLEVNHIPNVTRFEELRMAYISTVQKWLQS